MKALPIPDRSVPFDLILLRVPDLMRVLGLRQRAIFELRKRPDFPKPIRLTHRICAWRAVDIQRWQEEQIAKQQQG